MIRPGCDGRINEDGSFYCGWCSVHESHGEPFCIEENIKLQKSDPLKVGDDVFLCVSTMAGRSGTGTVIAAWAETLHVEMHHDFFNDGKEPAVVTVCPHECKRLANDAEGE